MFNNTLKWMKSILYCIPWMAGFSVDVQLEILVVDEETTTSLVDGEMCIVALRQQVHVVAMR